VGFPLDHPYVEQCLSAVIGPSCTLLLRRLPLLWREHEPAVVDTSELSRSLGLGGNTRHKNSRFWRSIERFTQYGLATLSQPDALEVYVTVRPLGPLKVRQLPEWSQRTHDRLLGEHLDRLATGGHDRGGPPPNPITARLNRLGHNPVTRSPGLGR
jgi:hypothetical protein